MLKFRVSSGQREFRSGFDSRQLHREHAGLDPILACVCDAMPTDHRPAGCPCSEMTLAVVEAEILRHCIDRELVPQLARRVPSALPVQWSPDLDAA